jgi:LysR family transcriptional regulator, benzoate and cis,cis-muconate-responsive activator of ben and cat genes
VTEAAGAQLWRALDVLETDIGLGLPVAPEFSGLASETLDYDIFDSIAIADSHPLGSRDSVSIFELVDEPFLSWKSKLAPEYTRQLRTEFARVGFKPTIRRDFDQVAAVASLVSAGQGWTLFPSKTHALAPSQSAVIPLSDFKVPIAHAVLFRREERRPVVHTVLDIVRRQFADDRASVGRPIPVRRSGPVAHRRSGNFAAYTETSPPLGIELRHLRYYCAVVDARSFGRAAERLQLTQPALSRQIRDLERVVGPELLERAARGATTTPAGESFYKSARRILDEATAMPAEAHRARRGMLSRCVIAAIPTTHSGILITELLRRCGEEMPAVEILIEEIHTPKQPAQIRAARVDLGLCHASPLSRDDERGLRRERLLNDMASCALVACDSPLASRTSLAFRDLVDIPFLFPDRSFQPALYDQLFSVFEGRAFKPRVDQSYEGLKTIWAMVAEGRGWALGFHSQCENPPPGTKSVPVDGFSLPWGIDVLSRIDESRSLTLLIIELLHDIARTYQEPTIVS